MADNQKPTDRLTITLTRKEMHQLGFMARVSANCLYNELRKLAPSILDSLANAEFVKATNTLQSIETIIDEVEKVLTDDSLYQLRKEIASKKKRAKATDTTVQA